MAGLDSLTNAISIECPVCLLFFTDPKTLPCCHTFCLKCLQNLEAGRKLTCPICREKHNVPKSGSAGFKSIPLLIDTLEIAKRYKSSRGICPKCYNEDHLTNCIHCNFVICCECIKSHENEVTEMHKKATEEWEKYSQYQKTLVKTQHELTERIKNYETKLDSIVEEIKSRVAVLKRKMRKTANDNNLQIEIASTQEKMSEIEIVRHLLAQQKEKRKLSKLELEQIKKYKNSPSQSCNFQGLQNVTVPYMTFCDDMVEKVATLELQNGFETFTEELETYGETYERRLITVPAFSCKITVPAFGCKNFNS